MERGEELEGLEVRRPSLEDGLPLAHASGDEVRLLRHELRCQLRLYWRSREPGLLHLRAAAHPLLPARVGCTGTTAIKSEGNVPAPTTCSPECSATGSNRSNGFAGLSIMLVIRRESESSSGYGRRRSRPGAYVVAAALHNADCVRTEAVCR